MKLGGIGIMSTHCPCRHLAVRPGRGPYSAAKWGVEGFSEVLSREVAPLGIKVTIVEPGGFRTDFAGSSTELREGHPAYDSTVGTTARFQRKYNGKQPGDPKKAAQAILHLTQERNSSVATVARQRCVQRGGEKRPRTPRRGKVLERTQSVH